MNRAIIATGDLYNHMYINSNTDIHVEGQTCL